MKTFAALILLSAVTLPVLANDVYVKPHVRKDGTYVDGHYQTAPDNSRLNNYSTQGNVNPYTGKEGTVDPYRTPQPSYSPPPTYRTQPAPSTPNTYGNSYETQPRRQRGW